jgi:hypothetical protein
LEHQITISRVSPSPRQMRRGKRTDLTLQIGEHPVPPLGAQRIHGSPEVRSVIEHPSSSASLLGASAGLFQCHLAARTRPTGTSVRRAGIFAVQHGSEQKPRRTFSCMPPRGLNGGGMPDDADGRPRRRALLVVNRKARSGLTAIDDAMSVLEAGGIDIVETEMVGREQICAEIREDAAELDLVILGGGDGTLNAAAPALVETGLPLGVLRSAPPMILPALWASPRHWIRPLRSLPMAIVARSIWVR